MEIQLSGRYSKNMAEDDERLAIQEAATSGLKSMEHLIRLLSNPDSNRRRHHDHHGHLQPQIDCKDLADATVGSFKRLIAVLNRTGHARFRRGPISDSSSSPPLPPPPPPSTSNKSFPNPPLQSLTLDFTKPNQPLPAASKYPDLSSAGASVSQSFSLSSANSSFMSSITGEGSVSNGKQFGGLNGSSSSLFLSPAVKPPISSSSTISRRCHDSDEFSGKASGSSSTRCHCSRKRKLRVKKSIRVPAVSSKVSDIPTDEYSWRKYGQKPIKGSPYPRGYYKCSTVRGCPARKHVERASDDPTMLVVTYEGEHRHSHQPASQVRHCDGAIGGDELDLAICCQPEVERESPWRGVGEGSPRGQRVFGGEVHLREPCVSQHCQPTSTAEESSTRFPKNRGAEALTLEKSCPTSRVRDDDFSAYGGREEEQIYKVETTCRWRRTMLMEKKQKLTCGADNGGRSRQENSGANGGREKIEKRDIGNIWSKIFLTFLLSCSCA